MRKFKHKITGYIATETNSEKNYKVSEPQNFTIPKWIVEDAVDWEEVKEFPKIISFRRISDKMLYTLGRYDLYWGKEAIGGYTLDTMITQGENTSYTEIYQVAVSETKVFTLGDKVKHPFTNGFDVISKFIICKDPKRDVVGAIDRPDLIGKLVANVGNCFGNCNIEVSRLEKAPEVLFITEDGVEKYVYEDFYYIGDAWNLCITKCLYKGDGDFSRFKTFHNREAAKQYISENKPIYSKKQIEEAFNYGTYIFVDVELFKSRLGL